MKRVHHPTGNRTQYLLVCSAAPQTPCAFNKRYLIQAHRLIYIIFIYLCLKKYAVLTAEERKFLHSLWGCTGINMNED
jgi:hypothetical protein